jgi:glycine/D-amino acid oxidase-like deaminating enzyme
MRFSTADRTRSDRTGSGPGDGGTRTADLPPWQAPPAAARPALTGTVTADVAVVGAGLTGLTTAYRLVRTAPHLNVVIVDADRPGAGASGRGTGLLGPRVGPPPDTARRRYGDATARRMYETSVGWVHQALHLIDELGADCDVDAPGQLMVAGSARAATALRRQAAAYRDLDLDPQLLADPGPFRAALRFPVAATLDPAALTAALTAAVDRLGVRRFDHSPVTAVHDGELTFPAGTVRARRTVVAVGGSAAALRLPVGTVAPMRVRALATAALPDGLRARLGRQAVVDVTQMGPYYRLTPDGRLIAGGGPVEVPASGGRGGDAHAWRWIADRLPDGVTVTHRWSGRVGMTGDGLPVVGRLTDSTWFAGGCCGHGLALSIATGTHLAQALTGDAPVPDAAGPLPWHRTRGPWLPTTGPARPLLRSYTSLLARRAARDGLEHVG